MNDRRSLILLILLVGVAALFLLRLFVLQIVQAEEYKMRSQRLYAPSQQEIFDRGDIYFTEKSGQHRSAATQKRGYTLVINPSRIDDPEHVADQLQPIVPIDREEFLRKANKEGDPHEEIMDQLSPEQAAAVSKLNTQGVLLESKQWRFYPAGQLASHVLGFVGFSDDKQSGRYGVERYYEDTLARNGQVGEKNFFAELFANVERTLTNEEKREGDLYLTIEPAVQGFLEEKIEDMRDKWDSEQVGGIIINPQTGAIYALAADPDFNPNTFSQEESEKVFSNPLVESVFEMGSIMKPLSMAAALDAGVVTPQTTYVDKGSVQVGSKTIRNFDVKERGVQTMQDVLTKSLNTGMVFVQDRLGHSRMREYLLNFEIGSETGVDVPGEVPGLVGALHRDRDVEFATAAFGQGIAVTPIAAVRAFSALANGGYLPGPHVVKRVDYEFGGSKKRHPDPKRQVIKTETSETITRMLVTAGDKLAGGAVQIPGYSIAAKTGTAQIPGPDGGYYTDRHHHSIFGYFPAYDPEFLIFIFNRYPKGATFAVETVPSPFHDIAQFLISYYEIPPDR